MAEPRTDVGTFLFRIPSPADGAKITVEYPNSTESVVFYLLHHGPNRRAAVQFSGLLLEIEGNEELLREVWQVEEDNEIDRRWKRDTRCMGCGQDRERFFHVCNRCLTEAVEAAFAHDRHSEE